MAVTTASTIMPLPTRS